MVYIFLGYNKEEQMLNLSAYDTRTNVLKFFYIFLSENSRLQKIFLILLKRLYR